MKAIACSGVTLSYGGRTVLADASFDIAPGEFIGILGPNGAGKTTLMRALLGLVAPQAGHIALFGAPPRRGNPAIGYLPQARGTQAQLRLRGRDFVASVVDGHRYGLPRLTAAAARDVDRALDLVRAGQLADQLVEEMSGGERQRLYIAQALIGTPRLLLLDEPLISLDPHHQRDMVALVKTIRDELGVAVLFSAHEINPLLGALDRVLHLGHQQAVIGSVDEVITGPILSRLYDMPVDVMRVNGRIFVMSGPYDIERDLHAHHH
jgi:zinc/manganese transport system ATP-binding protein